MYIYKKKECKFTYTIYTLGCGPTTGNSGKTTKAAPVISNQDGAFLSNISFCSPTAASILILKVHLYIKPTNIIKVKNTMPNASINGLLESISRVGPFFIIPLNASHSDITHTMP